MQSAGNSYRSYIQYENNWRHPHGKRKVFVSCFCVQRVALHSHIINWVYNRLAILSGIFYIGIDKQNFPGCVASIASTPLSNHLYTIVPLYWFIKWDSDEKLETFPFLSIWSKFVLHVVRNSHILSTLFLYCAILSQTTTSSRLKKIICLNSLFTQNLGNGFLSIFYGFSVKYFPCNMCCEPS